MRVGELMAEFLVVPALLAYGEAAFAYAGELRGPGLAGRLATWGVRLGWLAQTALLAGQAASAEGFPWGTWAGSLNLFVWLVVGAYLIWGCTPRYRLLGLTVMPVAAALLALAWAGGGTALDEGERSGAVLAIHVALMLAAFAGLTLAAGMAALYVWQERRLKRHERGCFVFACRRSTRSTGSRPEAFSAPSSSSRSGSASAPPASSAVTSMPRWR